MKKRKLLLIGLLGVVMPCMALEQVVKINLLTEDKAAKGIGKSIGTITLEESKEGLLIKSNLTNLPPGTHGFHVHDNPSCEGIEKEGKWVPGGAAGDHYDPQHTHHHLGPFGNGHLGDLPHLVVDNKGESHQVLLAPHIKSLAEVKGHSLMIHQGGDNYSDQPPLGGGGPRIACGVIG